MRWRGNRESENIEDQRSSPEDDAIWRIIEMVRPGIPEFDEIRERVDGPPIRSAPSLRVDWSHVKRFPPTPLAPTEEEIIRSLLTDENAWQHEIE